jgi:hypothetical protein
VFAADSSFAGQPLRSDIGLALGALAYKITNVRPKGGHYLELSMKTPEMTCICGGKGELKEFPVSSPDGDYPDGQKYVECCDCRTQTFRFSKADDALGNWQAMQKKLVEWKGTKAA